ncbi:MAG TPA: hypothetical protein VGT82_13890, partial [Ktedonobacteraceae bacterium]|nr:hypothetical protein [Ktedonobacteraceae bacterium]
PGGRLVIVDFKHSQEHQGQPAQFGAGEIGLQDLPALMKEAGFSQIESGEIPFPRLLGFSGVGFALGRTQPMPGKGRTIE